MIESQFAQESLRRLNEITTRPAEEQEKLLLRILEKNKDSVFGKQYGFDRIRSVSDYQKSVPYTDFEDYEPLIDREIAGERGVFTADPAYYFCISSGSLGTPKFFPLSREDAELQHIYWDGAMRSIIRRDLPEYTEEELFGTIFLMNDSYLTFMPDGRRNGVRTAIASRMQYDEETYPYELFYAPKEVLFPDELTDIQYVKLRFALARRDITAIHAVFAHKAAGMLRYLVKNWDLILCDMEKGEVSPEFSLNEKWTAYLKEKLPPDPKRAAELRAFSGPDLSKGLIRKIWPKTKYMRFIDGLQFHPFREQMDDYSDGLPLHSFVYAASEGFFGVAQKVGRSDAYILIPDTAFYEFIPEGEEEGKPLLLHELEKGKLYEILITTVSGLYRYRLGDVLGVVDFQDKTPVISVNYRKSQTLNLAKENMNAIQFENAISMFFGERELGLGEYCVAGNLDKTPPCYRVFMESGQPLPENATQVMDHALKLSCPGYAKARETGEIGEAEVILLPAGTFEEYERSVITAGGKRSEQTKPLKILRTKEQIDFFEGKGIL